MVVDPSQVSSTQAYPSATTASLTQEQTLLIVLQALTTIRDRRRFERYQAAALMLRRYPYEEISRIIQRSVTTVYAYIRAFRAGGLPALELRRSPGRPGRLTAEQAQQVADGVTYQTPRTLAFQQT